MMMDRPLLIAAAYYGDREIVSRTVEGSSHRYTYQDSHRRMQKLASAPVALGVKPGARVGTLAWNGYRHLELYYPVSKIGPDETFATPARDLHGHAFVSIFARVAPSPGLVTWNFAPHRLGEETEPGIARREGRRSRPRPQPG